MTRIRVDVGNFARAETHRMMADPQREASDINQFRHNRAPASVDEQAVGAPNSRTPRGLFMSR